MCTRAVLAFLSASPKKTMIFSIIVIILFCQLNILGCRQSDSSAVIAAARSGCLFLLSALASISHQVGLLTNAYIKSFCRYTIVIYINAVVNVIIVFFYLCSIGFIVIILGKQSPLSACWVSCLTVTCVWLILRVGPLHMFKLICRGTPWPLGNKCSN